MVDNLLALTEFSRQTYCRRVSAFNPVSPISAASAAARRCLHLLSLKPWRQWRSPISCRRLRHGGGRSLRSPTAVLRAYWSVATEGILAVDL